MTPREGSKSSRRNTHRNSDSLHLLKAGNLIGFLLFFLWRIRMTQGSIKSIGGQAVIEGVMMKAPKNRTVAVRDQKGSIHLKNKRLKEVLKLEEENA